MNLSVSAILAAATNNKILKVAICCECVDIIAEKIHKQMRDVG